MPGNEFGDRVHNFFAPDNFSQGQHQSQVLQQGNWPVLNSNIWVNGQMQVDAPNSSNSNYSPQNSDIDRRQASYPVNAANGLNFPRSDIGTDFCKNQPLNEQPYANGFMYGDQIYRNRHNESNFMPLNSNPGQHDLITSRGLPAHVLQQGYGPEQQAKASGRMEASLPSVGFDLFSGQQQINHQQARMMQVIQNQQPGLNDMQHLQQQLFLRKMQEFQRQQQLQQPGLRTQDLMNQASTLNINASGHQSTLVTSTPNSDTLHDPGTNWLSSNSSMQLSPSGSVFPPNSGQPQRPTDLAPQQVDQFLYGVPVSSSRGLTVNHYSQMEIDGSSIPQIPTSSNSQLKFLPDQNGVQDGVFGASKKIQTENIFGHSSSQLLSSGMRDSGALQHLNSMDRNTPQQDSRARQGPETISESLHERPTRQVTSSRDEVALDPTEEKILYGSDDNIWDVLGNGSNMTGETGNLFDNGGIPNGLQSNQSGIWSALMQSAVAETCSSDLGPQEWSGMNSHNTDSYPPNQVPMVQNDSVERASLPNATAQIPVSLSSAAVPPSMDNFMALNQLGHGFQRMPVQRVLADTPHLFGQSLDEANKQLNPIMQQGSITKGSQMHGIATQHSLNAERNAQTVSTSRAPRHGGPREQQNGLNALAGVPLGGDRLSNIHENEKTQNSHENQSRASQGGVPPGNSLWKSNSVMNSSDFGSMFENHQSNKGVLSLNDAASSEERSCNAGVGHETSPFTQNNFFQNQWKATHPSVKFQGGEHMGRMLDEVNGHNQGSASLSGYVKNGATMQDMENHPKKENSSDSHHSSLSQRASAGHRENRLSDAIDSKSSVHGKQKSINQLFMKDSVHRKFRYHPMGNLNDKEEPNLGPKQPSQEVFQKDTGPYGSCSSNRASAQGQNMLDLFQKLDQSGDHLTSSHISESNLPSQPHTTDKSDGSAGGFQRAQSSVSQGFGLELGPPSLQLQNSELPSSSPNSHAVIDSLRTCDAGAETEGKGMSRVPSSSHQSVPFPAVESQEFKNGRSAGLGHRGHENSMYKMRRNYQTAFPSDIPSARNQHHNQHAKSEQVPFNQNLDSSSSAHTPQVMKGVLAETVLPDSLHQIPKGDSSFRINAKDGAAASVSLMMDQMRKSQHLGNLGISQLGVSSRGLDNTLTKVHASQQTLAAQNPKASLHFSELSQSNSLESSSQGDFNVVNEAENGVNMDLDPKVAESLGKISSLRNHQNESRGNSASMQKDIQAFGRSLKPNNLSNERPVLINQMNVSRDAESDPSVRDSKRIKGSGDDDLDGQVNVMSGPIVDVGVGNSLGLNPGVPSGGFGTLSLPTSSDSLQRKISLHGNVTSRDTLIPGLDASQSHPSTNCATSVGPECQISPQMAPSWFNQYGNFKNGQMLPVSNAQAVPTKPAGSPFILGKPSSVVHTLNSQEKIGSNLLPVDSSQVGGTLLKSASTSVLNEQLLCPQPLQLNVTPEHQLTARPIKLETATSELHPWHKEISDGLKFVSTLSVAEAGWSKALNSVTQKVEDYTDLIEDGHPVFRMKRRLILTTQLTQQLFSPPPAIILSSDASSNYESVTYAVSRLALGDACSSVSFSRNSELPHESVNRQSAKRKLKDDPQFEKAIEELLGKKQKLENNFLRLEKRASVLDLRVELQDLEKYSLINRFAKCHGRGPNDSAETSSTNATAERSNVQRYVTALPMPKNIPDRVEYLSL